VARDLHVVAATAGEGRRLAQFLRALSSRRGEEEEGRAFNRSAYQRRAHRQDSREDARVLTAARAVMGRSRASPPNPIQVIAMRTAQRSFVTARARRNVAESRASYRSGLFVVQGDGSYQAATDEVVIDAALAVVRARFTRTSTLTTPRATREFLRLQLGPLEFEVFSCVFLDNHHRVLAYEEMFRGTIDGASVHPREVVKRALALNAAALIVAHGHPSGVAEPSQADELVTRRLQEALALVGIRLLDIWS
jgi:DNA repair protein RadC